jgi:peptidyl-dipeptidase A
MLPPVSIDGIRGGMEGLAPHRLVSTLEDRFRDLEIDFHSAYWDSQVAATAENDHRRAELELALRKMKGDAESLQAVQAALQEDLHEPVLRRQLEVLRFSLTANRMDDDVREELVKLSSSVESDFASHRPFVKGERMNDNEITEILRASDDESMRRSAWAASKEIGKLVAPRIRELARLRNAVALGLGYSDYYSMALDLQELDQEWLSAILAEVDRMTEGPFFKYKDALDERLRTRFGVTDPSPWHYADPFFQMLPPEGRITLDAAFAGASAADLALRTFAAWGIDLEGVMEASDLFPRENKSQHAFCLDVDRSGADVRILANVVPGERWVEVMLHESGHAAFDVSIDPGLPYLLRRPSHIFVTEAIALLSGSLARDPRWLVDVAGLPISDVARAADQLRSAEAAQRLVFARWALVVINFERALYLDPDADLDARWWELVERFQGISAPEGRAAPDWAAKVHVAAAPVYYQNYLLGDLLASQLRGTCERDCGGLVGVPAAGELLRERVFKHGSVMRWDGLVEAATGEPLSARAFADELILATV